MPPITLLIKPASGACNMRCKYCFYADVMDNRSVSNFGMLSDELHETMVKNALAEGEGSVTFAFQGGEPTLRGLDFFQRHVKLIEKHNVKKLFVYNTIQTNGYVIDDQWASFLADNNFLVGLSMDGTRAIHDKFRLDSKGNGTYDRVLRCAKTLDKHKVEYNILCVVNNVVARNGVKVLKTLIGNGFKYIQFIPCLDRFNDDIQHDFSLNPKNYARFLKSTFDIYYKYFTERRLLSIRTFDNYVAMLAGMNAESCGMNGICNCYFVVEGNGNVYPCDFYVLDQYLLGNIATDSFSKLLHSDNARKFVRQSLTVDDKCRQCRWFFICRGGCRRNRQTDLNGSLHLNEYCSAFLEFFPYAFERLQEMAHFVRNNQGL